MSEIDKTSEDWLKLARDAWTGSSSYLDTSLRTAWEDSIKIYANEHPKGSKYNTDLYTSRSKVFRPKTRASAMSNEAAVATAFFSTTDLIDVSPQNENDPVQVASARINKNLLQYRLTKTIPWFQTLLAASQEAWKMGNVCSYQTWKYEEDSKGNIIKDEPYIELVPLENLRVDPNADWVDPINNSPYVIQMIPMYVYEVRKMMELAKDTKTGQPAWFSVSDKELMVAKYSSIDSIRQAREGLRKEDPKQKKNAVTAFDIVWIHRNIINKDGKDWVYYTLSTEKMLTKPKLIEEVYLHGERPYVMGSMLIEPFKAFKTGMPELGQPIQEEINNIANDRLDNVKYVLHKRYFAKRGRNVDFRSLLRNIPGSITLMDNPTEDVQVVSTPDITSSAYAEQDRLNADYDELVGNFSQGSVQTNKSLNETVGGMGMLAGSAGQIQEYRIRVFTITWAEKVLRQLIKLEQAYETDLTILTLASTKETAELYQKYGVNIEVDELIEEELTVDINVGITSTNPQFKVEKFMFAIDALGKVLSSPAGDMMDLPEVIKEVFGLLGYKDGVKFFTSLKNGEDPRVVKLKQQVTQLSQLVEGKKIEEDAKYRIDRDKLQIDVEKLATEQEKAKADTQLKMIQAQEVLAKAEQIKVETQRMLQGVEDSLEIERIQLGYAKITSDNEKALVTNKTKRDEIVAGWEQTREANDMKLKITLANRAMPSNDIISQGGSEGNEKKPLRKLAAGGDVDAGETVLVGDAPISNAGGVNPEVFLGEDGTAQVVGANGEQVFTPNQDGEVIPTRELPELISPVTNKQFVLPEGLVDAVISAESSGNKKAISVKGAVGLMQLTPIAVKEINRKNLLEQEITFEEVKENSDLNKEAGTAYLEYLIDRFGSIELGLAAYNAGPTAVSKAGNKVPNIKETKDYVKKIMGELNG